MDAARVAFQQDGQQVPVTQAPGLFYGVAQQLAADALAMVLKIHIITDLRHCPQGRVALLVRGKIGTAHRLGASFINKERIVFPLVGLKPPLPLPGGKGGCITGAPARLNGLVVNCGQFGRSAWRAKRMVSVNMAVLLYRLSMVAGSSYTVGKPQVLQHPPVRDGKGR